jgi:sporulation protein YlmC with PRC-barrel domain
VNAFMVEKIIGSRVMNLKGQTLGKIEDLVIDIDTGKIMYAILDFGGFLGIGNKLFPVPWESLAALPLEGIFFLNQSKEQLEKAPGYDKNNLPDMGDLHWGSGIYKYYGVPSEYKRRRTGYGYYGYGYYPWVGKEDPYTKIFDPKKIKTITGQVIKVEEIIPYGTGLKLIVYVNKKEILPVYLGPFWYVEAQGRSFKSGDKVSVTGSVVSPRGEPFMIAMTVGRGNEELRLREKDGTPAWIAWKETGK